MGGSESVCAQGEDWARRNSTSRLRIPVEKDFVILLF